MSVVMSKKYTQQWREGGWNFMWRFIARQSRNAGASSKLSKSSYYKSDLFERRQYNENDVMALGEEEWEDLLENSI